MMKHRDQFLVRGAHWTVLFGVCVFATSPLLALEKSKLDDGLEIASTRRFPIFVRFEDQLFRKGGDYEQFTKSHNHKKRSELRAMVLKTLKEKSDRSWKQVSDDVLELEKSRDIRFRQNFWIVNGFACVASGKALKDLSGMKSVAFIFRQRGATPQDRRSRLAKKKNQNLQNQRAIMKKLIADWRDDSNDELKLEGVEIPWNLKKIRADKAWIDEKATGKGIVIGLIDSGLMRTPSLTSALWKNPKEVLNGKDDDGNGYVDDIFGYNFNSDSSFAVSDAPQLTHGSMCGGILAGRANNKKKLLTGVAPRARLMVLKGLGLMKAYEYAFENGADIISMSYMFIRIPLGNYRSVFRLAHEHLAAGGVVSVGGAGNFYRPQFPNRVQIAVPKDIPCVICAAGIVKNGKSINVGSRGPVYWNGVKFYDDYPKTSPLKKPDVTGCAGGFPVWGRAQKIRRWIVYHQESDRHALVVGPRGNSFSGPHAGGVAALMLSVNPELKPWQIKSLMISTCKDLGAKGWDKIYGAGLLQADAAVRAAKRVRAEFD